MSWKIKDVTVDAEAKTVVDVQFDSAGVDKENVLLSYMPNELGTQEQFYNKVVADIEARHVQDVKTKAEKDAEDATNKATKKSEADAFVAANETDPDFKLKNLKDTDV